MSDITTSDIIGILTEVCAQGGSILPETELLDSGRLDSLAFIELLNALEDRGIDIQPTRVQRECFRTPVSITVLCHKICSRE